MKGNLKISARLYGKIAIATLMSFFIVISVSVLTTGLMTNDIGYKAYGVKEESNTQEFLYEYLYSDGEDTEKTKYEELGYTVTEQKIVEMSKAGESFFLISSQVFALLILIAFIYSLLWKEGIRDNNLVKFGHKSQDKFRGVKIGFIASIPYALFVLVLFVLRYITQTEVSLALIQFINSHIYTFVKLVLGSGNFMDVSFIRLLGLLLLGLIVPIISGISYFIGYKDIALGDKIFYKIKKKN